VGNGASTSGGGRSCLRWWREGFARFYTCTSVCGLLLDHRVGLKLSWAEIFWPVQVSLGPGRIGRISLKFGPFGPNPRTLDWGTIAWASHDLWPGTACDEGGIDFLSFSANEARGNTWRAHVRGNAKPGGNTVIGVSDERFFFQCFNCREKLQLYVDIICNFWFQKLEKHKLQI
jgi:hypothetical protein